MQGIHQLLWFRCSLNGRFCGIFEYLTVAAASGTLIVSASLWRRDHDMVADGEGGACRVVGFETI